jgi:hypothetical protein
MEYNKYPEVRDENGKIVWTGKPRQLKKGETVVYELINLRSDNLDKTGKKKSTPFIKGIGNKDKVYIPIPQQYQDKKYDHEYGDGVYVDIAYAVGFQDDGSVRCGDVHFKKANAHAIFVTGGKANDQSLFEFLESCNWNAKNPNRDTSYPAEFAMVNHKAKSAENRKQRDVEFEAYSKAKEMTLNELTKVAVAIGHMKEMDEEVLRDTIEIYAKNKPERFLNITESTDTLIQYNALQAQKLGLIEVDMQKRKILNAAGGTLHTWTPGKNVNWTEKFVDFVKSEEGQSFYKSIKDEIKGREVSKK